MAALKRRPDKILELPRHADGEWRRTRMVRDRENVQAIEYEPRIDSTITLATLQAWLDPQAIGHFNRRLLAAGHLQI
jgi:hypothetical protein